MKTLALLLLSYISFLSVQAQCPTIEAYIVVDDSTICDDTDAASFVVHIEPQNSAYDVSLETPGGVVNETISSIHTYMPTLVGEYTFLSITDENGCTVMPANLPETVVIEAISQLEGIIGELTVCLNNDGRSFYSVNTNNTEGFIWDVSNGAIVSGQGTDVIEVDFNGVSGSSIISVSPETCSNTNNYSSINVNVSEELDLPYEIFINDSPNDVICEGSLVDFTCTVLSLSRSVTVNWFMNGELVGNDYSYYTYTTPSEDSVWIKVEYTFDNPCTVPPSGRENQDSAFFRVFNSSMLNLDIETDSFCETEGVKQLESNFYHNDLKWFADYNNSGNEELIAIGTDKVDIVKSGAYRVELNDSDLGLDCPQPITTGSKEVIVYEVPVFESTSINIPSIGKGQMNVVAYPFDSVKWGTVYEDMDPTILRPTFTIIDSLNQNLTNQVTLFNGTCQNSAVVNIDLDYELEPVGNVSGYVQLDTLENCIVNIPLKRWVKIEPGPYYVLPDSTGFYTQTLPFGNYNFSIDLAGGELNLCSNIPQLQVDENNLYSNLDILVSRQNLKPNISLSLVEDIVPPRPGFDYTEKIYIENIGTKATSTLIKYVPGKQFVVSKTSSTPIYNLGDTLVFELEDLAPNSKFSICFSGKINNGTLGENLESYGIVEIVDQNLIDEDSTDNTDVLQQRIVGSYDPNDKQVSPIGDIAYKTAPRISYMVRFQNTGTYPAYRVVIRDTLQENFDLNTLELGAASHDYTFAIYSGNVLTWTFEGIMLPDSNSNEPESHGFVKYYIKPKENLPLNTVLKNEADIYFDFNEPIITNKTENTIRLVTGVKDFYAGTSINAYPNPAVNSILLETEKSGYVKVYNTEGLVIKERRLELGEMLINLSGQPSGVYIIHLIYDDNTSEQVKVIKQ